ncbi:MAG: DUF2333 family protein [Gammaproteobacteria bacterium]|nr:DUF2333 family protein [Gammaproteobacteria bacterium]MDJ0889807.1 DUF2333 family protein [Gammaproteobacteria bacterium]
MTTTTDSSTELTKPESTTDTSAARTKRRWKRIVIGSVGTLVLAIGALGAYWSLQPDHFDVKAVALERVGGDETKLVRGAVYVATIGEVARTLFDKPGGYLYNDLFIPGVYLDNMPSWEYGVIKEIRDSLHALRNDFSRSQTQSIENIDLRKADEFLNYNVDSWVLPSTESEYMDAVKALDRYFYALVGGATPSARFFARADNLAAYLAVVEKRLGSYAQRLSASVGDSELTAALVKEADQPVPPTAVGEIRVRTPRFEIDDVFYEARGYAWGLLHSFKALAIEFESVLDDKNAAVSLRQVIRDLEEATKRMWSPMVLNGHGFGYVVNHSLVLASYISRANAAVLDLRILLQQG